MLNSGSSGSGQMITPCEFFFLLKKKKSPLHIREIGFDGFQGSYKQSSIYNQEKIHEHYKISKGCNQKSQAYMAMTLYTMFCDFEFVKEYFFTDYSATAFRNVLNCRKIIEYSRSILNMYFLFSHK